ncbi:MAG: serine protein kinase RIO [Candidatus Micrarchaeota archaeon]|nr:serine protein kinase RIO [Candidatus Micrarchaeota archaeon]
MARMLSKRKRPKREEKQFYERPKLESSVFDRPTMLILSGFIKRGIIDSLDYPMATGKEADVFRATLGDGYRAVKIYRIDTGNFQKMQDYMTGDPRFSKARNKRNAIFAWARKEFSNLRLCAEIGVNAPKPYAFKKNVLVIEFLGEGGIPDSSLKEIGSENPEKDLETILGYMGRMHRAGFVHSDLSEYNILMHGDEPYIIDVGQAVALAHPKSREFFERDVRNLLRYFSKYGITRDAEKEMERITGTG